MAKDIQATVLPDPLPSFGSKPSPKQRKSAEFLKLQELTSRKLTMDKWDHMDADHELLLRATLGKTLEEHFHFCYLGSGKIPLSMKLSKQMRTVSGNGAFYGANGTSWLSVATPPSQGPWGAIPKLGGRGFVLDFDITKDYISTAGDPIRETTMAERRAEALRNVATMGELLGVDLRKSYWQASPSGGIHVFLLLPAGVDPRELPRGKFPRSISELAGRRIPGDIRSGGSNGMIVMAGSNFGEEDGQNLVYSPAAVFNMGSRNYSFGRKIQLLELPESSVDILREWRGRSGPTKERLDGDPAKELDFLERSASVGSYRGSIANQRVAAALDELTGPYHQKRAFLQAAVGCCATTDELMDLSRQLDIDRDSYRGVELSDSDLRRDFERLQELVVHSRHGAHCSASISALHVRTSSSSEGGRPSAEQQLNRLRSRQANGNFRKRKPVGFDLPRSVLELIGNQRYEAMLKGERKLIPAVRRHAVALLVGYFSPLANAGSSSMVASRERLGQLFDLSPRQVGSALALLRSSGILELVSRQKPGLAATYGAGKAKFQDRRLTANLRTAWGSSARGETTGMMGSAFDYRRGALIRPDGSHFSNEYLMDRGEALRRILEVSSIDLPRFGVVSMPLLKRYLHRQIEEPRAIADLTVDGTLRPSMDQKIYLEDSFLASPSVPSARRPLEPMSHKRSPASVRRFPRLNQQQTDSVARMEPKLTVAPRPPP